MDKQELRQELINNGFNCYVFFTMSNSEVDLAEELNKKYEYIYCLVMKKMMHRSLNGKKWDEESVLIKGYVFVYTPLDLDIKYIKSDNNPFRILKKELETGKLFGDDYLYAKWLLNQNGMIGLSKAVKINSKVKIIDGPLKELEGYIVSYSPRNRNCQVEIKFMNQTIKTWLPFEYTDQNYIPDLENL